MKNIKHGFTLAEMLAVLGIVAVLATISMTVIKSTPNHEKMMLKKSYYLAEQVINELVNDSELYPEPDNLLSSNWFLANTTEVRDPRTGREVEGPTKFCELFKARMDVLDEIDACGTPGTMGDGGKITFTTTDGVDWFVRQDRIQIDVNGQNKGDNCFYSNTCPKPDRFTFNISSNGRIAAANPHTHDWLIDTKVTD